MTLVSTLGNIGQTVSSSVVLYIADRLPKQHAYSIEVVGCTVIGVVTLLLTWRMMHQLQALPVDKWYLVEINDTSTELNNQEISRATSSTSDAPS